MPICSMSLLVTAALPLLIIIASGGGFLVVVIISAIAFYCIRKKQRSGEKDVDNTHAKEKKNKKTGSNQKTEKIKPELPMTTITQHIDSRPPPPPPPPALHLGSGSQVSSGLGKGTLGGNLIYNGFDAPSEFDTYGVEVDGGNFPSVGSTITSCLDTSPSVACSLEEEDFYETCAHVLVQSPEDIYDVTEEDLLDVRRASHQERMSIGSQDYYSNSPGSNEGLAVQERNEFEDDVYDVGA